jgi:hypothetical protein
MNETRGGFFVLTNYLDYTSWGITTMPTISKFYMVLDGLSQGDFGGSKGVDKVLVVDGDEEEA